LASLGCMAYELYKQEKLPKGMVYMHEKGFSDEKNLIAPCGNFCGSCALYRCAAMGDTEGQRRLAEHFSKGFPQYHSEPEGMVCIPCGENFDRCWSPDCEVYICCVKEERLDFCYECDDFPCEKLRPYRGCPPAHNLKVYNLLRIKKIGWREWLEKQKEDTRELHARY